jgi:UDP-N-acetylmuramoyl-L-alanyl-D-glutamate--2,6-diaminopimelate ligase
MARRAQAGLSAAFPAFRPGGLRLLGDRDGWQNDHLDLIYRILRAAGLNAGMISTVSASIGEEVLDTGFHVTTPEAPDVQRYLARMVERGLTHVVLEATSHGLAQQRVAGCDFDLGVLTNITHEHLDYHGTYEAYRDAKALLFTGLAETPPKTQGSLRTAVLNRTMFLLSG